MMVLYSSNAFAQFTTSCPATYPVWVADFNDPLTYWDGSSHSSPHTNNSHTFSNPSDFEGWEWTDGANYTFHSLYGDGATQLKFPTDSNGDPINGGEVWMFMIHGNFPDVTIKAYDKFNNALSINVNYEFHGTYSELYNVEITASSAIAYIYYEPDGNEAAVVKTCAW
jgi:hypothetical protein